MSFELVIFELTSLFVDATATLRRGLSVPLAAHGFDVTDGELDDLCGVPLERAAARLLPTGMDLETDAARTTGLVHAWTQSIAEAFAPPVARRPRPDLDVVLADLRRQRLRIAVVSSLPRAVVEPLVDDAVFVREGSVDVVLAHEDAGCLDLPRNEHVLALGESRAFLEMHVEERRTTFSLATGTSRRTAARVPTLRRLSALLDLVAVADTRPSGPRLDLVPALLGYRF